jgi:hypothetical protein
MRSFARSRREARRARRREFQISKLGIDIGYSVGAPRPCSKFAMGTACSIGSDLDEDLKPLDFAGAATYAALSEASGGPTAQILSAGRERRRVA